MNKTINEVIAKIERSDTLCIRLYLFETLMRYVPTKDTIG